MTKNSTHTAPAKNLLGRSAVSAAALAMVLGAPAGRAADINLFQNDAGSVYSFAGTQTNWGVAYPNGGRAVSGNNYYTNGKTLQSNGGTFGGTKLVLDSTLLLTTGSTHNLGTLLQATGALAKIQIASSTSVASDPFVTGTSIEILAGGTLTFETQNTAARYLHVAAPMSGAGNVALSNATGTATAMYYDTAMSYSGKTTIGNRVYLRMGVANALSNAGEVAVDAGGFLRLAGQSTGVKSLSGVGTVDNGGVTSGSNVLTISGNDSGTTTTFSGTLVNGAAGTTLNVAKTGAATQVFSGANTYTGTTTISGGTLEIQNAAGLGSSAIGTTVSGTGTLGLFSATSLTSAEVLTLTGRSGTENQINNRGGTNTLSGAVTLATGEKFNLAADGTLNVTGAIGTAALDDAGAHELNLSGTGTGTIAQGVAFFADATNTLNKTGTGTWNLNSTVTNLDGLNVSAGTLALGAGVTVDGNIAADGTLQLKATNATARGLTGSSSGTVTNVGTGASLLTLGSSDGVERSFAGTLTNTGGNALSVVKTGSNRQVLSGTTSYTGTTTISDGQLQFAGAGSLSNLTGKITVTGSNSGTLELNGVGTSADAVDLVGRSSATSHIDNIAGDNTLSGAITLVESDPAGSTPDNYNLNVAAGSLNLSSGVSVAPGDNTDEINLNLSAAAGGIGRIGAVNLTNAGSGVNDIVKTGDGTWYLNGATSNVENIGVQDGTLVFNSLGIAYNGDTTIADGATLLQGVSGALGTGAVVVDGALDLGGFDTTLHGLNGAVTGSVTNSGGPAATLTIDQGGSFAGTIVDGAGGIALTKVGNNTQVLAGTGTNTYSGLTTISGGTLRIEKSSALGTATGAADGTLVESAGTLALANAITSAEHLSLQGSNDPDRVAVTSNGNNTLSGPITLVGGGSGYLIESETGTLTVSNSITAANVAGDVRLDLDGAGDTQIGGPVNLSATGLVTLSASGDGDRTIDAPVTLSSSGLGGLAGVDRSGGGDMTVNGDIDLTAAFAGLSSWESGTLTVGNVDMSGAVSGSSVEAGDTASIKVNGALQMQDAGGNAVVVNYGAGSIETGNINASGALGAAGVENTDGGSVTTGDLDLSGAGDFSQVRNSGAGTITVGAIDMRNSANAFVVNAGSGTLTVTGTIDMTGVGGDRQVASTGNGGILTVEAALTAVDVVQASNNGTLVIGAAADVSDVSEFVLDGGVIDAAAIVGGFELQDGQTLSGDGLIKGDVIAGLGSVISPGSSPGTQHFDDDLTLLAGSLAVIDIDLTGANDDLLLIDGLLTLTAADIFDFVLSGSSNGGYFVFAQYGSLSIVDDQNNPSECSRLGVIPAGFSLVCDYNQNYLALYKEPTPSPAPAPIFLMGLGALAMGAARRWRRR